MLQSQQKDDSETAAFKGLRSGSGGMAPLRVAICGTRGIPACYGGFETFAEELSTRLVARGHSVLVYGRSHVIDYKEPTFRGVKLRLLPAPKHKYLETPVHSLCSLIDVMRQPIDVVLVCNAANSPFVWIPRFLGRKPVAVNLDGIERKRSKWNVLGRIWYRLGEQASVWFANEMISDAEIIRRYYSQRYGRASKLIRYGCRPFPEPALAAKLSGQSLDMLRTTGTTDPFAELGIQPGSYLLYVSRLEPENNALRVVHAYMELPAEIRNRMPLVVVGDAPYADSYIRQVHAAAGPGVIFAGYRFGEQYELLQQGAYTYIQATEVGGTHPALVEAIGYANCVIGNRVPEHVEVLRDIGMFYNKNDTEHLSECMAQAIHEPELVQKYRQLAYARAQERFNWERITDEYEELLYSLVPDSVRRSAGAAA